jgi:sulfite reductase (NADPH) hemoprotein beta-component
VDKHGQEWYQITLGGSSASPAALGEVIGPSVPKAEVAETISRILEVYVRERRSEEERFLDTVRRIGIEPFQERVYAADHTAA